MSAVEHDAPVSDNTPPTNDGVRALASHAVASILTLPIEHHLCQEYRAGIAVILQKLREGNAVILERISALEDRRLQRFLFGSTITEEWWQAFEKGLPAFLASFPPPTVQRCTETQYETQIALSARKTDDFLKEDLGKQWKPETPTLFSHTLRDTQEHLLFDTPFSTVHGHLLAGVATANFYSWELLRILPDVCVHHRGHSLCIEDTHVLVQAANSIPRLLALLARLHITTFVSVVRTSADAPPPPRPQANFRQRPAHFWLRETPHALFLEIDPTIFQGMKNPLDPGIGCPASYARDRAGKDVVTSFFRNLILPLWTSHCLPHLFSPQKISLHR